MSNPLNTAVNGGFKGFCFELIGDENITVTHIYGILKKLLKIPFSDIFIIELAAGCFNYIGIFKISYRDLRFFVSFLHFIHLCSAWFILKR